MKKIKILLLTLTMIFSVSCSSNSDPEVLALQQDLHQLKDNHQSSNILSSKEFKAKFGLPTKGSKDGDTEWLYYPKANATVTFDNKNQVITGINDTELNFLKPLN